MDKFTSIITLYERERYKFEIFLNGVYDYFRLNPNLNEGALPLVHSLKSRLKDPQHLKDKLQRKDSEDDPITLDNFFDRVTDLAGIRILHLYQKQFIDIHNAIISKVSDGDWVLFESPCAYTWDPEAEGFYRELGINCMIKESYYTSVHYVIMPKENSPIKCEIQVRTLYEEIWGEIAHCMNYPYPTDSVACREQLRVLSKLSVTGRRLADSILNSHEEFIRLQDKIQKLDKTTGDSEN